MERCTPLSNKDIRLSARLKAVIKNLEARGEDPSMVVESAIQDAISEGRGKAGGFGKARQHVDQLVQSVRSFTQQDTMPSTEKRFGDEHKNKRPLRRLKHKEVRREQRKEQRKRAKHNYYAKT
jgi:hypothetical protein